MHVYHTSNGFLGIEDPIGDVDFYPNGLNNQPLSCPRRENKACGCPNVKVTNIPPFFNHNQGKTTFGIKTLPPIANRQYKCTYNYTLCLAYILLYLEKDCSHVWGVEFLIRLWEQNNENWYCNSTIYCTSIPENFPNTTDDVTGSKVTYLKRYHLILQSNKYV